MRNRLQESVCLSVITLTALMLISAIQTWYYQNRHDAYKVFDSSILLKVLYSKVMASFTARPYIKYYSYPNDDTKTATFDRTVLIVMAMLTMVV